MEQSAFWEANRFSVSQYIGHILRKPKVNYRIHKIPPQIDWTEASVWFRGFCVWFVTWLSFYGKGFLALRPNLKLENHPLSAVRNC